VSGKEKGWQCPCHARGAPAARFDAADCSTRPRVFPRDCYRLEQSLRRRGVTPRHNARGNFQSAAPISLDAQVVIPMTRIPKRIPIMSSSRAFTLILLAAAMATGAHAQTGRTRAEVKAELAEAIRTGNMIGSGESGLTQRELNPQRYGITAGSASTLTRAQVTGQFQQARAAGELVGVGESGLPLNEMQPGNYPQKAAVAGRTRAEVQAELREAIRTGNMLADGDSGQLLKDLFPQRYANVRPMVDAPVHAGMPGDPQAH
jgi:hypothetical protein